MSSNCDKASICQSFNYDCGSNSDNLCLNNGEQAKVAKRFEEPGDFFTSATSVTKPVVSVARRNERERKRVRLVNQGFAILRERVPRDRCTRGRRSSKVETLRAAIMYIRQLQQLLLESQNRLQEQNMSQCYTYIGENLLLNCPTASGCDNCSLNNEFSVDFVQPSPYHQLRSSLDIQHPNQLCEHHLTMPWFDGNDKLCW